MMRQMTGAGATVFLLLRYYLSPAEPQHMGVRAEKTTPACAESVSAWCISTPISRNTS